MTEIGGDVVVIRELENSLKWFEKLSERDQEKLGREILDRVDELWMQSELSKLGQGIAEQCGRLRKNLDTLVCDSQSGLVNRPVFAEIIRDTENLSQTLRDRPVVPKVLLAQLLRTQAYLLDDAPRTGGRGDEMRSMSSTLNKLIGEMLWDGKS